MTTFLLAALAFYYNQIALGNTSPGIIRDYVVVEALVANVDPQLAQAISGDESHFNCNAIGDHGTSYGCWQIHLPAHPDISADQAKDPIFSTEWSMHQLAQGNCKIWSTCPKEAP